MRIAPTQILATAATVTALLLASAPAAVADARTDDPRAGNPSWDLQRRLERELEQRTATPEPVRDPEPDATAAPAPSPNPFAPDISVLDDLDRRRAIVEAHTPKRREDEGFTASLARRASLHQAGWLAWWGQHDAARVALERAVALGDDSLDTWVRLAAARARSGDLHGAEASLLGALEQAGERREKVRVYSDLGAVYLGLRNPQAAMAALEVGLDLNPDSLRMLELYARARFEAAPHWEPAPPAPVLLFPESASDRTRSDWESRLLAAHEAMPAAVQDMLGSLAAHATSDSGRLALAALLAVALVGWMLARRVRGRGDLAVTLAYPPELAGSFSVRLARTPGRYKRQPRSGKLASNDGPVRASTKTEHFAVSRETKFQGLRAGLVYVTVEGLLQDPDSGEIVTDPFEEQAVQVMPKETIHIDFEVAPRESVVDVRVTWDGRPARDASVAARGLPQSLRYARDGSTRLRLRKGTHTIVIGSGDRVAECEVELESFRAATVEVDLASREYLIFKGCPPAVEPYLNGDLSSAARALDRDGHTKLANLLQARLHHDQERLDRAAEHYEAADHFIQAAELRAEREEWREAAALFERGGAPGRAADMLRAAGEHVEAGAFYEQDGDYDSAIDCYREASEYGRWIDALEKNGAVFPAARLAVEQEDRSRAIRLLQRIDPDHAHFEEACDMLTSAYLQEGHRDLAVQKIEERIEIRPAEQTPPDVHSQHAELLEQEGEFTRALEVLAALREREPTYPNIATRIEGLRKKQSERELSDSREATGGVSKPTAFLEGSRYDIQEEIGRGGMGVVLKARDTRLDRTVALKRLPETLRDHPKAIQLFLREAQSAARLNHPNITTVYDTDQEDGIFFITMELLEGSPISKILKKRGRISEKNAAQLGVQIAAGLDYAHAKGVVHRDIKSANLFFTNDKVVKIMDFGLAKMLEEVRRGTTVVGGTPYYMAPEQAAGDTVDHRADLYALGVTLYEFVIGKVPFLDGDVTYQHRHAPVPDPREKVKVSDAFAEIIMELMAKEAGDRPDTAAEVAQRLEALIR